MLRIKNNYLYVQLVLVVMILTALGIVSSYYFQKISIERQAFQHIPNYEKRFNEYIDSEAGKITSYLELVKEKKELQLLFQDSNRNELYEKSLPIFEHLNKNSDITHFYFMKPNGEVLLRVHDQNRFSDVVERYTFLKSKESNKPFCGIEFGIKKNYTLRVVHPWIIDGELIGYIELGKEVDKVIEALSKQFGIEIYFAVKKSVFKNSPKFVEEKLKKTPKTDTQYIVYKTDEIPANVDFLINGHDLFNWVELDERIFISYKNPLVDVSGTNLGMQLYLVNITESYDSFLSTLFRYGFIMVVGTTFMLVIGFLFARASNKKINIMLQNLEVQKQKAEELSLEQQHLLSLFDKGDSVLFKWNYDDNWSINYVSSNVSTLLGYTKKEFMDQNISYLSCIHKDDIEYVTKEVEYAVEQNLDYFKYNPYRIVTQSGEIKWVLESTVTQKNADGVIEFFIGYISDITEQKRRDEEIKDKLQKFIDTQNNIVILTDGKTLKFANDTFLRFFGHSNTEEFVKNYKCICNKFIEQDNFFHLGRVKENESHWVESLLSLSGRARVVSMIDQGLTPHAFSVSINYYEKDEYVVSFTDISDTMVEKFELTKEATIDLLTNVYNRVYFKKHISSLIASHKKSNMSTGIVIFDIDNFKNVNDTYGHDIGDNVLKSIASLVKKYTRVHDKVIRWGGEEFIIVAEVERDKALFKIAEHLRSAIEHLKINDVGSVTCSFGCAIHNEQNNIVDTIKEADEKLYEAKNSGKNRVVY